MDNLDAATQITLSLLDQSSVIGAITRAPNGEILTADKIGAQVARLFIGVYQGVSSCTDARMSQISRTG